MLQMDFVFFNIESNCGFTSTFVAIYSATSYPFGFTSRRKHPPLEILKYIVTTLSNQDKKDAFTQVDEYGEISIFSEFMKAYHDMNIIVKSTGGDQSSLNGKCEILYQKLSNIKRDLLLNSSRNKELWCFTYQYAIWISRQTENILRGDVT